MPTINFYITDNERMELFDYVTSNDGGFVPRLHYIEPKVILIESKTALIKCIYEQTVGFYLVSSRFQTEPLAFGQFEDGEYYIMQKRGGPCIDFAFYHGCADGGPTNVSPIRYKRTTIFHYPRYVHYDDFVNYDEFLASDELKAYYKMIVKFLKSKCRQITAKDGYKYWISKTLKE